MPRLIDLFKRQKALTLSVLFFVRFFSLACSAGAHLQASTLGRTWRRRCPAPGSALLRHLFFCTSLPHGIAACFRRFALSWFCRFDCRGRWIDSGACFVCRVSVRAAGHLVWHQQRRVHLGHGIGHLAIQPPGQHGLACAAAGGASGLASRIRRRLAGYRGLARIASQNSAWPVGLVAGLYAGEKRLRARTCAALCRPPRNTGACKHRGAGGVLRWFFRAGDRQFFCVLAGACGRL